MADNKQGAAASGNNAQQGGAKKPKKARKNVLDAIAAPCSLNEIYFFLPAIDLAGPLRVRALVWVRWPRTGSPRR